MDLKRYHPDIARIAETRCEYPENRFSGTGIVMCAGGRTYFTCAWVLVNLLRRLGCWLPIEVWYRGRHEMNDAMLRLLESVADVRCMSAADHGHGCRLDGWEIKPYAIIHSRFEEVLFLDCDNVPTRDPSGLFDEQAYRRLGAVFWPDRWMGAGDPESSRTISPQAWVACDVRKRDEPEFESGQMLIDKRRCWRALRLAMFFNERSDFFYRWLLGDKDTFHMAWRRIGQQYAMPMFRPRQDSADGPVLYQHDFQGSCLFQHRNQDKWDYHGGNACVAGFEHEESCSQSVEELRRRWDGVVCRYPGDYTSAEQIAHERITSMHLFRYAMDGVHSRLIELKPGFEIGLGKGRWETAWDIEERSGGVNLTFHNGNRKMCILDPADDLSWHGRCLHFERAPISVEPVASLSDEERTVAEQLKKLLRRFPDDGGEVGEDIKAGRLFTYRRIGHGSRPMEFVGDHTIARGAAAGERWWFVDLSAQSPELLLWGDYGPTCSLSREPDGVWRGRCLQFEQTPVELLPGAQGGGGPAPVYCGSKSGNAAISYYGSASVSPETSYYGSVSVSPETSYYGSVSGSQG
ncbi:MAG: hypothetical protein WBF17_18650 [Phycisphaerae bacterium]